MIGAGGHGGEGGGESGGGGGGDGGGTDGGKEGGQLGGGEGGGGEGAPTATTRTATGEARVTLTPRDAPIEEVKLGLSTVLARAATSTLSLGTSCMSYVKPLAAARFRLGRSEARCCWGEAWRW